jgi:LysM repeat protein
MTAGRSDRGPVRIRRRGRHTAPSQVEKVAQQAGKAAPAVAIAGALVTAPTVSHALAASAKPVPVSTHTHTTDAKAGSAATSTVATLDSVSTRTVTVTAAKPARHSARTQSTTYEVRSGDTLSGIADRVFHNGDWQYLYFVNEKTVPNPNLIYTGEKLVLPAADPEHYTLASYTLTSYTPRHARPAEAVHPARTLSATTSSRSSDTDGTLQRSGAASIGGTSDAGPVVVQSAPLGQYSCSALERLWDEAGGNSADAFMAAEIAMAESGGNPNAISPTADYGLWQINASNGSLATLNPFENARSAITLSADGTNWNPWTTYHSGAYYGRC